MGSKSILKSKSSSSSSSGKFFPPGFRFHPTDEELVLCYLKRKICHRSLKPQIIGEVDVYKWDPEELPGQSKLKTHDRQWFFFCPRGRKYPNGGRASRATSNGYWKATGKDRIINGRSGPAGIKKTLVYYKGRAPSGQRTDWVMHEYTMDEEEFKRCRLAQEHYALCKVFKKSGPGPKNGAQYGAPFVEEEWSDEDCLDVNSLLVENDNTKNAAIIVPEEEDLLSNDIVEILNKIVDKPDIIPPLAHADCVVGEEENENSLLEYSLSKVDFHDQRIVMGPSYELYDVHPGSGSGLAQSAYEASDVTSLTNVPVEKPQSLVFEDFLEMDDLIDPQPAHNSEKSAAEALQFADFDRFSEFDLYHDATGFCEMGAFETQPFQQAYDMNNLEYGTENSCFHMLLDNVVSEVDNHHQLHDEDQISYDLWNFDQRKSTSSIAQATHEAISQPLSGVVVSNDNLGNPNSHVNQYSNTQEDDGTNSWFTSALWAFVGNIPTTPASASESSALVNRAFERMSSFSRGRNVKEAAAGGGVNTSSLVVRKSGRSSRSSSRGIIYFSVLGVFFAILWVFLGGSIELLGRCIS